MNAGGLITRWTRQRDRLVQARTHDFRVDKMLADIAHHAATVSFHDEHGTAQGHWDQVLGADQSFALALLATAEVADRSTDLAEAITRARNPELAQAGARITALVESMLHLARDLDKWLAPAQTGGAMEHRWAHGLAEAALDQVLGPQLQRLFDQVADAEESRLIAKWGKRGWSDDDGKPWQTTVREGEMRGISQAVERAWAQRLIRQLAEAAQQFLEDMTSASTRAAAELEGRLQTGAHDGHAALVIAFAEMFRHAHAELDALPDRVLDYWLTQLRAEPTPARGDQVLLAVVPRPGVRPEVPKGLLIPADKDVIFVADTALTVTGATITELRIWANEGVSVSRAIPGEDGRFTEALTEPILPMALLTSPALALPGGTRRIRVRLTCVEAPEAASDIAVAASTATGWIDVGACWAADGDALLMTLLLPSEFPALGPCPGMDMPALRLTAPRHVDLQVSKASFQVAVRNAPDLVISTPAGPASASAAAPFGNPPFLGGWLRIDHPALAGPPLDRLVVRFDWASVPVGDAGFAGHYRGYVVDGAGRLLDWAPFDNAAFTVTLQAPVPGWDGAQQLPLFGPAALGSAPPTAAALPPDILSDTFDDTPLLMPEEGPVAPSSWLAAARSDGPVTADHVLVTLASPAEAFGHGVHAANVQWATEAMARAELPTPRPGLIRRWLLAVLGLPKAIGEKLSGRQSAKPEPVEGQVPVLLPNPPFQPMLSGIALDYAVAAQPLTISHLPPFEVAQRVEAGSLFPAPLAGATLELVVDGAGTRVTVALLWQLGSSGDAAEWWYRSVGGWAPLAVLEDGTAALSVSGILRVAVPSDAATGGFRIQARFAGAVPEVLAVLPNAFSATRRVGGGVFHALAAGTIAKLPGVTGVAAVVQPLDSMGGSPREADAAVRARMIERVRHGGRAQTCWDLERLVLTAFPEVDRVRVTPAGDCVTVLVEAGAPFRAAIAAWLNERVSPFARITVTKPERVRMDVSAELVGDDDMSAAETAVRALIEDGLTLEDAAGVERVRAAVLRLLIERREVKAVERLRVTLSDCTGTWRVLTAGTISIAAVRGAVPW